MSIRTNYVVVALLGGVGIYCTNAAVDGASPFGEDSAIPDARSDNPNDDSCTACAVEPPEIIFDGSVTLEKLSGLPVCSGPEWDVREFKSVVVHRGINDSVDIFQKHGPGADYVKILDQYDGKRVIDTRLGGMLRVGEYITEGYQCGRTVGVTAVGFRHR